jgi:hypothetical protein
MVDIAARTALVLETNNLRGGDSARTVASLLRLMDILVIQTVGLASLRQVVITHDGLDEASRGAVGRAAGRPLDFVLIDAGSDYYEAKNIGFAATDAACDYVVFADADCVPACDWLERLLEPMTGPEGPDLPQIVAGRTSYRDNLVGTALTTLDFMYFPSPLAHGATRNFYANNVAFRRDVFSHHCYQALEGVYRAHCQVLGLRLQAAGIPVRYAPQAHTVHRLPDTRREALALRWMRGEDSCGLTPFLVRSYLPPRWQWLGNSGPLGPLCVLAARLWYSLRALNHQDLPAVRGLRRLGAVALIVAFSAVDMAGAFIRGAGLGLRRGATYALSYHRP